MPFDNGYFPLCMVTLDAANYQPIEVNDLFEECMGPLYKFQGSSFLSAASDESSDAKIRLEEGLRAARNIPYDGEKVSTERIRVRNVEMTTLAGPSGFPIRRFFDWFIRPSSDGSGELILLGDLCTDQDVCQREKESELIDFFQNAPIALHWLSRDGKVLWANQTELNVLGYTAEEYIGQDIMKFCPDEKELVLEIFQQLGSGNTIKDVPVRFRTKDERIVHLLIDSNVKYNKNGSFGHTRCFIRDDTGRKIREARASLILEETKRSLKMLDNFVARSLHHLRTPLHVTQNMVDFISVYFKNQTINSADTAECIDMVKMASVQIDRSVTYLDDLADLAKFDQGAVMRITPEVLDLENFGNEMVRGIPPTKPNVQAILELRQGGLSQEGPSMAVTDQSVLKRIITHLLNNAVHVTNAGDVVLEIGYKSKRLTFAVSDKGPGLEMSEDAAEGDLPIIFQKYHQELLPEEIHDLVIAESLRERIEHGINTHQKTGMGIGLSLTYHLVQALGGELRCNSTLGQGTRFYFSLPVSVTRSMTRAGELSSKRSVRILSQNVLPESQTPVLKYLAASRVEKPPVNIDEFSLSSATCTSTIATENYSNAAINYGYPYVTKFAEIPEVITSNIPSSRMAFKSVKCQTPPSVLVVEDTHTCAKILCRILSRFKCATNWAENGKIAIDILKESPPGAYDLILMDLRMPVMDGLEATRIIKNEMGITTPVVALTGDFNEATRDEASDVGFDAFYGKPMKREDLVKVIKEFTGYDVEGI